jgi:hypothetical protein
MELRHVVEPGPASEEDGEHDDRDEGGFEVSDVHLRLSAVPAG